MCLEVSLQPLAAGNWRALLDERPPPHFPHWWPHVLNAHCNSGVSTPGRNPPADRTLGACSAQSGTPSTSPPPSRPGTLSPCWPRVCPCIPGSPQRLDCLPDLPVTVSLTCSHAWSWCHQRRQDAFLVSPCCLCPPPCPAVVSAPPPSPAHSSSTRCHCYP